MGDLLKRIFGERDSQSLEEQFEVIVSEIDDHQDKLVVWQFPGLNNKQLQELHDEVLDEITSFGMKSEHIFVAAKVDIDELIADEEHIVRARDKVFEKLSEEEQ